MSQLDDLTQFGECAQKENLFFFTLGVPGLISTMAELYVHRGAISAKKNPQKHLTNKSFE